MELEKLNRADQIGYLIGPIIQVLQEAGGQLLRQEIRERIANQDEFIAEFEQKN